MPPDRDADGDALLEQLRDFFETHLSAAVDRAPRAGGPDAEAQMAAAALAIEMSRADFEISAPERQAVVRAVQNGLGVAAEWTEQLVVLAEQQLRLGRRMHEFTRLVDERFTAEQKRDVVELLWRIAFADAELKAHEEYLVRKISELIHVPFEDFLAAKIRAREHFFSGE